MKTSTPFIPNTLAAVIAICLIAASCTIGCNSGSSNHATAENSSGNSVLPQTVTRPVSETDSQLMDVTATPEGAVDVFIGAVYRQDQEQSLSLLTPKARLVFAKEYGMPFSPPASAEAVYKIIKVTQNGADGAYVESTLTDFDSNGNPRTDPPIIWAVSKTSVGWRIAGAAIQLYSDSPSIVLDFENRDALEKGIAAAIQQEEIQQQRRATSPTAPLR